MALIRSQLLCGTSEIGLVAPVHGRRGRRGFSARLQRRHRLRAGPGSGLSVQASAPGEETLRTYGLHHALPDSGRAPASRLEGKVPGDGNCPPPPPSSLPALKPRLTTMSSKKLWHPLCMSQISPQIPLPYETRSGNPTTPSLAHLAHLGQAESGSTETESRSEHPPVAREAGTPTTRWLHD